MNEIVQRIIDRAGISEESATIAMNAVMDVVKERLPAPIAGQVEKYLVGDTAPGDTAGSGSALDTAKGALSSLFGKPAV